MSATKNATTSTTTTSIKQPLRLGTRVRCTDDQTEGRIAWANGMSVKIRWDDGEEVTWRRDSLPARPIEVLGHEDDAPATPETTQVDASAAEEPVAVAETAGDPAPAVSKVQPEEPLVGEQFEEAATPAPAKAKRQRKAKAPPAPKAKGMSALDAAALVLSEAGGAMGCQEMIEVMGQKRLWSSPNGKTPAATLYAAILRELQTKGDSGRFVKADRGKFALRTPE
jgi:hypothetical protein